MHPDTVPYVKWRAFVILTVVLLAPAHDRPALAASERPIASISWTAYGVPHIRARSWYGAGYGHGYAFARDNLCTFAETVVTLRAKRSRYFGPEGDYTAVSYQVTNLNSDFFWQRVKDQRIVENGIARRPPLGPSARSRALVRGYAAGYNRYLADTGVDRLPDPRCRGKEWVRRISATDIWRRAYQLVLLSSGGFFIDHAVAAQPPGSGEQTPAPSSPGTLPLPGVASLGLASNALALGREGSANGRGLLLANPHFPWQSSERFYQAHLTIPGQLDVSGAALFGMPQIAIGHTRGLAWSHTVSTAWRFTPYELTLVPGDPTAYRFGNEVERMRPERVGVLARTESGDLERREHTFWATRYGLVVHAPDFLMPWTAARAYALADANADNFRSLDQALAVNQARDTKQLEKAQSYWQGVPWVNTLAADRAGRAYYADQSVVPHLSNAKLERCVNSPVGRAVFAAARLPVLDGSDPECAWGRDADAVAPGIFGPSSLPRLRRRDYVENSNDSHWLTNPHAPLEGYPQIVGPEATQLRLRTRIALATLERRLHPGDREERQPFTDADLRRLILDNRNYSAELARDAAVASCVRQPIVPASNGEPIDVRPACPILAAWDLRADLDSRGEALWREFFQRAAVAPGGPWRQAFDRRDPINTPNDLNTTHPAVIRALADAVQKLRDRRIPLDAPWGSVNGFSFAGSVVPLHGCLGETEGCLNDVRAGRWVEFAFDPAPGDGRYPQVTYGSSFLMSAAFTKRGPRVHTLLAHSQSENPNSPHALDQTHLFARKQWVKQPFTQREIATQRTASIKLRPKK